MEATKTDQEKKSSRRKSINLGYFRRPRENQTTPIRKHVDSKNTNTDWSNSGHKHTATNVFIAGDSMIRHINGYKMSNAKTKVKVDTFPGCTTLDMNDYTKPLLKKKPDKLLLHIETNSLKHRSTST